MASQIHFKLKSAKDFDSVTFSGMGMRLRDLKVAIADKKVNDAARDFDLLLQNEETKAVYMNDNELVPKNTRVIVTRQAAQQGKGLRANATPKHLTAAGALQGAGQPLRGLGLGSALSSSGGGDSGQGEGQDDMARSLSALARVAEAAVIPGMDGYARQQAGRNAFAARRQALGLAPGEELPVRLKGVPQKFQTVNEAGVATLRSSEDKFNAQTSRVSDVLAPGGVGGGADGLGQAGGGSSDLYGDALPAKLTCPLCKQLVGDAVVLAWAKLSACEKCVGDAMRKGDGLCPLTNKKVRAWQDQLVPNKPLRRDAESFKHNFALDRQRAHQVAAQAAAQAAAEAEAAEAAAQAGAGGDGSAGGRNASKRVGVDAELDFTGFGGSGGDGGGGGFGGGGLYDDFENDDFGAVGLTAAAAGPPQAPPGMEPPGAGAAPTSTTPPLPGAASLPTALAPGALGQQPQQQQQPQPQQPQQQQQQQRGSAGSFQQCRDFARGSCARGAACAYAHGDLPPSSASIPAFGAAAVLVGPPLGGQPPVGPPPPGPPPPPPMRGMGLGQPGMGPGGPMMMQGPGDYPMGGKGMGGQWGPGMGPGMGGWDAGGKGFAPMGPLMGKGGWGGPMGGGWGPGGGDWGGDWGPGGMGKGGWGQPGSGGMGPPVLATGKGGKGGAWENGNGQWGAKREGPEVVGGELKRGRGEGF